MTRSGCGSVRARSTVRVPPARPRPSAPSGRSWRNRCSGRSARRSPRGSRPRPGPGSRSSSARAVIIIPGVQNPHCRPWHCMKPCCTGSSTPSCSRPSTVRTSWPPAIAASTVHDFTGSPSIQHHAGAAVAGVAAPVGAGQAEHVAQEVHEQQPALDLPGDLAAVDGHRDLHRRAPFAVFRTTRSTARRSVRRVSSSARCRLYSALPRWSVDGRQLARRDRARPRRTAPRTAPARAAPRRSPGGRWCSGRPRPGPTRASAISVTVDPDRGARRDHRPVAGPALDLRVGARPPGVAPGSGPR